MTTTREAGQSIESAEALQVYMDASTAASDANLAVTRLLRELKAARAALKNAKTIEAEAERAYYATPYGE